MLWYWNVNVNVSVHTLLWGYTSILMYVCMHIYVHMCVRMHAGLVWIYKNHTFRLWYWMMAFINLSVSFTVYGCPCCTNILNTKCRHSSSSRMLTYTYHSHCTWTHVSHTAFLHLIWSWLIYAAIIHSCRCTLDVNLSHNFMIFELTMAMSGLPFMAARVRMHSPPDGLHTENSISPGFFFCVACKARAL